MNYASIYCIKKKVNGIILYYSPTKSIEAYIIQLHLEIRHTISRLRIGDTRLTHGFLLVKGWCSTSLRSLSAAADSRAHIGGVQEVWWG